MDMGFDARMWQRTCYPLPQTLAQWRVCQDQCSGWGRRYGTGSLRPANRSP